WNFFDKYYNKGGKFKNYFELHVIDGRKLVLDNATGLMWLQGGSSDYMAYEKAQQWVADLNREKYAGFSDWRLPTLEEAASLMKSTETRAGLFTDPVFASEQQYIWTADNFDENKSWAVDFFGGDFNDVKTTTDSFVRAVRSQTK
ncbi:MAG: DUF1566 domain-containing protein, partial [bacterium]|nr:DUF1566 domain-containing protein [bacterium]